MTSQVLWLHAWGVGFGLVSSLPAGPATVLMVQRTLRAGRLHGFAALSGLLLGEALYIVAFVLGARRFLAKAIVRDVLAGAGAFVLVAVAVSALRSSRRELASAPDEGAPAPAWTALRDTFAVTITNPATVMLIGGLATGAAAEFGPALVEQHLVTFAMAMEMGAVCWFVPLIAVVGAARRAAGIHRLQARIGRVSAVVLVAFAAYLVASIILRRHVE